MSQSSLGTGPGAITPDGCSVDLYTMMPAGEDPGIVHDALPAGASILELGAGVGRVTRPLVSLGHEVIAVDESPEMLAYIERAETVHSTIEDLDLDRRFDAVLLMSHLIETPDDGRRRAFLRTCRSHVRDGGLVILQRQPPEWYDTVVPFERETADGYTVRLRHPDRPSPGLLSFTMEYEAGGNRWTQTVVSKRLEDAFLESELIAAGLTLDGFLTPDRAWVRARG